MQLKKYSPYNYINDAHFIWHPYAPRTSYAVVLFRKPFYSNEATRLTLEVTACQRYILFLDGILISRGPSRSYPEKWLVKRLIIKNLPRGKHVLASIVFNFVEHAGKAQMGDNAFFWLRAVKPSNININTSIEWRTFYCKGWELYLPEESDPVIRTHTSKGERIDISKIPPDWTAVDFDDSRWENAVIINKSAVCEWGNLKLGMLFNIDPLPEMQEKEGKLRLIYAPEEYRFSVNMFLYEKKPLYIKPGTECEFVFDAGEIVNAYPMIKIAGGSGKIKLITSESVYDTKTSKKIPNRQYSKNSKLMGDIDEFVITEPLKNEFTVTTLWFRCFRYLMIIIQADSEIVLFDIYFKKTSFPLKETTKIKLEGKEEEIYRRLLDISLRTVRLCSHETFFDCPKYEQSQFSGDSRIMALIHYMFYDEDTLACKAIDDIHASRLPDGMILSHYPCRIKHIIPTYGLYWIKMLKDMLIFRDKKDFIRDYIPSAIEIVNWFLARVKPDGLLGKIEFQPFIDWCQFQRGSPPQDEEGNSSILTLLLANTLIDLASILKRFHYTQLSDMFLSKAKYLNKMVFHHCYERKHKMISDIKNNPIFSVHAQVEAILSSCMKGKSALSALINSLQNPDTVKPGTFYYTYYVIEAFKKLNCNKMATKQLRTWIDYMQDKEITTWPESLALSPRSECHGWSASPAIEIISLLAGINPDPEMEGFKRILINPYPPEGLELISVKTIINKKHFINLCIERQKDKINLRGESSLKSFVIPLKKHIKPGKFCLSL